MKFLLGMAIASTVLLFLDTLKIFKKVDDIVASDTDGCAWIAGFVTKVIGLIPNAFVCITIWILYTRIL